MHPRSGYSCVAEGLSCRLGGQIGCIKAMLILSVCRCVDRRIEINCGAYLSSARSRQRHVDCDLTCRWRSKLLASGARSCRPRGVPGRRSVENAKPQQFVSATLWGCRARRQSHVKRFRIMTGGEARTLSRRQRYATGWAVMSRCRRRVSSPSVPASERRQTESLLHVSCIGDPS